MGCGVCPREFTGPASNISVESPPEKVFCKVAVLTFMLCSCSYIEGGTGYGPREGTERQNFRHPVHRLTRVPQVPGSASIHFCKVVGLTSRGGLVMPPASNTSVESLPPHSLLAPREYESVKGCSVKWFFFL